MQVLSSKWIEKNLHRKIFGRNKESKWGTSCKSKWIKQKIYSELTRNLFLAGSTSGIKIKITHHSVIGDKWIWEGISLMNVCRVSQPMIHHVLNDMFKRSNLIKKLYFIEKKNKGCVKVLKRLDKFRAEKNLCMFISCDKQPLERHKLSCRKTIV